MCKDRATSFSLNNPLFFVHCLFHKQTGENAETAVEQTKYEHVLKPYIYYTARYKNESLGVDVVVNYSLDNYVVITGFIGPGKYVTNSGYLVNLDNIENILKAYVIEKLW